MLSLFRNLMAVMLSLLMISFTGWDEARSEQVESTPEYCPSSAGLVPDFNSGQLARLALNCYEGGFKEEALQLFLASEARRAVDAMYLPPDSPESVRLTDSLNEARSRMEAVSDELLAMDRWRIETAFLSLIEMQPLLQPGYDPGWEHRGLPQEAVYQSEFEFMVANYYATVALEMQLNADPVARSLQAQLENLRDGSEPTTEVQREEAIARFEELNSRFEALAAERSAFIVPELVAHRVRNFGLYHTKGEVEIVDAAGTADGSSLLTDLEHAEETTVVPARIGVSFGYEFELGGIIPGTMHLLKMRAIHPPIRNVEGEMQTVSTAPFHASDSWGTRYSDHITYAFNSEYHLVPGPWTLQVLYGDEVIISKEFRVVEVDE